MAVVASSYLQAKVVMTARTRTQFPEAKNAFVSLSQLKEDIGDACELC
jgi:hypothetical protein